MPNDAILSCAGCKDVVHAAASFLQKSPAMLPKVSADCDVKFILTSHAVEPMKTNDLLTKCTNAATDKMLIGLI